jgi:hypothetical protein
VGGGDRVSHAAGSRGRPARASPVIALADALGVSFSSLIMPEDEEAAVLELRAELDRWAS